MALGLVGRKLGMTRLFTEAGVAIPVTVIAIESNRVTQVKTLETDGYRAIQVTCGSRRASRVTKPQAGHFAKANVEPGRGLWEFTIPSDNSDEFTVGQELTETLFEEGQWLDVQAKSKGKGFAGVVKRHNFSTQDATHGNSLSHRAPGSIGQNQSPGKVFKGKKMAGQMGNKITTAQNLELVKVCTEKHLLLVKGAVPGASGSDVIVTPAAKKQNTSNAAA